MVGRFGVFYYGFELKPIGYFEVNDSGPWAILTLWPSLESRRFLSILITGQTLDHSRLDNHRCPQAAQSSQMKECKHIEYSLRQYPAHRERGPYGPK